MTIEVLDIVENEDGSADMKFDVTSEEELKTLVGEGLNFLLLKSVYGLTTEQLIKVLESSDLKVE